MASGFKGIREAQASLAKQQRKIDFAMHGVIKLMSLEVVRTAKDSMRQAHQPNTPTPAIKGNPPAVITGNLKRSIKYNTARVGFGSYIAQVGPTMIYGRRVELPEPAGFNYPYMATAARVLQQNGRLRQIYLQGVTAALKL